MSGKTLAMTGATGFVGQVTLGLATAGGWHVRALVRKPQTAQNGVSWISGALDDAGALAALMEGADAVLHIAGVVNAPDRAGFAAGNIAGTAAVVAATKAAGIRRFIHVSSLSAREAALSDYGWSKAESETVVRDSGLDWTVIRPPAVYGPGDHEMLDLFRIAKWGIVPMPPTRRLSLIEVSDLARLLLALMGAEASIGQVYEPDDGHPGGWSRFEFGRMIGEALGKRTMILPLPGPLLRLGAKIDQFARGNEAKLTSDRAAYMCHEDWVISEAGRVPLAIWEPKVETRSGLKATVAGYRAAGWL